MTQLRTEYPFRLPKGYVDDTGAVHTEGTMRLATARDELDPLNDPKVRDADDPYLTVIVLSRVITQLGAHARLTPRDVEGLFAADLAYLQDVYATINYGSRADVDRLLGSVREERAVATRMATDEPAEVSAAPARTSALARTSTPISDAARSMLAEETAPGNGHVDDVPEPEPVRSSPRARIEEVGRSSGRPG